jgi:hypothetical protein
MLRTRSVWPPKTNAYTPSPTEDPSDEVAFPVAAMGFTGDQLAAKTDVHPVVLITSLKECPEIHEKHMCSGDGWGKLVWLAATFEFLADALRPP